jgi:hypothetical protein
MCQRVLFISGSMVVPDYEDFLQAVQPALLHKPLDVDRLRDKVRRTLTGV